MDNIGDLYDTKLHEAVRYGDQHDIIEALEEGCDPNQIGIYLWSPLHEAAHNADQMAVNLLLNFGGDPNRCDLLKGNNAMHYAAIAGNAIILKLLIDAGGKYDVPNRDGKTCLDLASEGDCQKVLRQLRDKYIITPHTSRSVLENLVLTDLNASLTSQCSPVSDLNSSLISQSSPISDNTSFTSDIEVISIGTNSSGGTYQTKAWGMDRQLTFNKSLVLGYIQLSFEYHVKKEELKIRVWQVADILFPPAHSSNISSVYVKSYLQPDNRRATKQKTEELSVSKSDNKEIERKGQQHIVNFKPVCFKFTKALAYQGVTKQTVASKLIEVQLCIVQKLSRRSFAVASFNIPLSTAVKKLVKEKFPLHACLSTSIPENMKVYALKESLHLSPSSSSASLNAQWATAYEDQPVSVQVHSHKNNDSDSVKINMADDYLEKVEVVKPKEKPVAETRIPVPGVLNDSEDEFSVRVDQIKARAEVSISVANDGDNVSRKGRRFKTVGKQQNDFGYIPSRPETPTWDDYMEPLSFTTIDDNFDIAPIHDPANVVLPMATSMNKKGVKPMHRHS